ncbi:MULTISPECIES: hypothetical protein [Pyrobaculum]|uniref:Uncharacterized protein n=1 Tax=Pyrobaculum arsenaticum TaxID=121277 RepID=A0A7L4P9T2_9CREN|nr:hypothetical protein [Pyrobaculum arsenaticum]MCY0891207.1 hypothetical protein [Pyrobaculum arsenaticum]NYR15482.1 hypothetical protein [Pyrobaculum arsenaticum]
MRIVNADYFLCAMGVSGGVAHEKITKVVVEKRCERLCVAAFDLLARLI